MTDPDEQDIRGARQRIAEHFHRRLAELGLNLADVHRRTVDMEGGQPCGCKTCQDSYPEVPTKGTSTRILSRLGNPDDDPTWRGRPNTIAPVAKALGWPSDAFERMFDDPTYTPPQMSDWTPNDRARLVYLEREVAELRRVQTRVDQLEAYLRGLLEAMQNVARLDDALDELQDDE